jgi:hypothetical protein
MRKRKPTLVWRAEKVGGDTDYRSADGQWWIAEGFDTYAAKQRRPFLLMHCAAPAKDRPWRRVDGFKSVSEAKNFAEEMSA